MDEQLIVVGLTGGISCGKSAVAGILRAQGIPVMDADRLGHLVMEQGGIARDAVVQKFGKEILDVDGLAIDRAKLGAVVFNNPEKRRELEEITHPAINQLAARGFSLIKDRGGKLVIYEAALLVETGIHKSMAALIVVSCSLENQIKRLCARDGFSREAAAARIASQLPDSEKVAVADYVVENDGTVQDLESKVISLAGDLKTRFLEGGH